MDIFILAHASGHRDITMAAKVVALDLPLHNTQPRAGGRVLTRKSLFSRMWAQPKPGYRALAFGGWFSTVIRLALGVGHTAGFPPPLPPLLFAGRLTCGHYKPVQLTLRPHSDDELSLGLGVARAFFDAFSLDGGPLGEWLGLRALPRWPGLLRLRVIRAEHLAPFVPSLHPRDLSPHWVAFIDNIAGQFALMKDDGEAPSRILASFWGLLVAADKSRAPSEANVSDSMGDDSCARAEGWTRVRALVDGAGGSRFDQWGRCTRSRSLANTSLAWSLFLVMLILSVVVEPPLALHGRGLEQTLCLDVVHKTLSIKKIGPLVYITGPLGSGSRLALCLCRV